MERRLNFLRYAALLMQLLDIDLPSLTHLLARSLSLPIILSLSLSLIARSLSSSLTPLPLSPTPLMGLVNFHCWLRISSLLYSYMMPSNVDRMSIRYRHLFQYRVGSLVH